MAMSENTQKVFKYLQSNNEGLTAQEIADAIGLPVKTVNGAFTMGIAKKDYGYRSEEKVKVELEDGTTIEGKQLFLTDAGLAADVDALAAE